ncbi:hypothetical protein J2TS4_53320 [Paenibacillus sp. J2TS4]|nr:hypothetical protein J2TS4_53320 [Paenibacillus sp. J2TS4]
MIEIVKLYAGYGLDSDGFIVSDVSKDKINDVYIPCIQESIERLRVRVNGLV